MAVGGSGAGMDLIHRSTSQLTWQSLARHTENAVVEEVKVKPCAQGSECPEESDSTPLRMNPSRRKHSGRRKSRPPADEGDNQKRESQCVLK